MSSPLPRTGVFHRIWWRQDPDDPERVTFRALDAEPARGPDGEPLITLMTVDTVGILTLSTLWQPPAEELEALRDDLSGRLSLSRASIRLAPAPVHLREAVLELETDDGPQVLSRATVSDSPPYPAAFRATVRNADLDRVRAALGGEKDVLRVRYSADARKLVGATARITGPIRAAGANAPETAGDALLLVEAGKKDGSLSVSVEADPEAPPDLAVRARAAATTRAVEAVRRMAAGPWPPADTDLDAKATLVDQVETSLTVTSDVGDWLESTDRKSHMIESGTNP